MNFLRGRVGAYTCGFPCQPFSLLHNGTRLFGEADANVFFQTLATVLRVEPLLAVLENVIGIMRVWRRAGLGKINVSLEPGSKSWQAW